MSPPPRLRRRPVLAAASAVAVTVGALGSAWAWTVSSDAQQVVAARSTIQRGAVIARGDLVAVRVGVDPALSPLPASRLESLVGQRAAMDVAAGSLVTSSEVTRSVLPARGLSLVGVGVTAASLPGTPLVAGDRVRIVATPAQVGDPAGSAATGVVPQTIAATVVSTSPGDAGLGTGTVVSVQVPSAQAAQLAAWSSTGKVAIVLDSRER